MERGVVGATARRTIIVIVALYVLPFLLVWIGLVPVDVRRWLYVVAGLFAAVFAMRTYTLRELGIGLPSIHSGITPYAIFGILGAASIVTIALLAGRVPQAEWWLSPHFRYGILIPVSVAQEFFYRSMLMPMLRSLVRSQGIIIAMDASLFAFLHVVFPDPAFVLPLSLLGGVMFAMLWLRWPNLMLASAAHIMLNAAFVLFCFGSFEASCLR